MLEKPVVEDNDIVTCLQDAFGLRVTGVTFLPVGADRNSAAYRAVASDGTAYFVKLRQGNFDETSVTLPRFLGNQGVSQIIMPLPTRTGGLWASLGPFAVILYPFVAGQDAYAVPMSDGHWIDLGRALRRIHTIPLPRGLTGRIARERFAPQWRDLAKAYVAAAAEGTFVEPVAVKTAALLRKERAVILNLVARAERLARALVDQPPEFVLCHADIHAGNILIRDEQRFCIVDWDNPLLAPKERDLMSIGAGLMGGWRRPDEEETLFYQGYGPCVIDPIALAYYRYARIIDDIAVFCAELLGTTEGGEDREQSFAYLASNFLPGNTIDIAYASDATR